MARQKLITPSERIYALTSAADLVNGICETLVKKLPDAELKQYGEEKIANCRTAIADCRKISAWLNGVEDYEDLD